jgi:hypothetical protein
MRFMAEKVSSLPSARLAREFLDKYGDLPMSALPMVKALAVAREACLKSAQAVGERLAEPPRPDQKIRQVIALAARNGDAEAKILLESGLLNMLERSSPTKTAAGRP